MLSPFFRDPLMWDPMFNDSFDIFQNDPFFNPYGRRRGVNRPAGVQPSQQQQQLTGGVDDMNKDSTALSHTGGVGQQNNTQLSNVNNNNNNNVGFWNFDRFLNEPLSLGLEDKNDRYVMNVVKPAHIGDHDLKIDVNGDILTVHGEQKQEKEDKDEHGKRKSYSFSSSSFSRSIKLPSNVDQSKISANMNEPGKLVIELPKIVEQKKELKQIPINRK